MKKKNYFVIFLLSLVILISGCGDSLETASSAIKRELQPTDSVIILSPGVPLAGSPEVEISKEIFLQVNAYRKSNNLNELSWSVELEKCATVRAEEASILWSHTRPDGSDWWSLNPSIMYGENLAKGYTTASEVVTAWQNSYEHNANLLYPDFKYMAISKVGNYYSAEFCY